MLTQRAWRFSQRDAESLYSSSSNSLFETARSFGQTARHQDSHIRSNAGSQTRRLLWLRHDLAADVRAILRPNAVWPPAISQRVGRRARGLLLDRQPLFRSAVYLR